MMIYQVPLSADHIAWIEKRLYQEIAIYVRQKAVGSLAHSDEQKLELMQDLKTRLDSRFQGRSAR